MAALERTLSIDQSVAPPTSMYSMKRTSPPTRLPYSIRSTSSSSLYPRMATVSNFSPLNPTRTALSMPSNLPEGIPPRQGLEPFGLEGVQAHGHPVQAGVEERLSLLRQQDAVGRQGEVFDPGIAPQHADQDR